MVGLYKEEQPNPRVKCSELGLLEYVHKMHGEQYLGEQRKASEKKKLEDLIPQEYFIPWIVLGLDFLPLVTNIYIQIVRHVYSYWVSEHSYRTQYGQCTLNLVMAFSLAFMLSQI